MTQLPGYRGQSRPLNLAWSGIVLSIGLLAALSAIISPRQASVIAAATFVSEDLTCIATGQLIQQKQIDLLTGLIGCFVGIFVGDLGLWLLGRLIVRRIITWPLLVRLVDLSPVDQARDWLDDRLGRSILAARLLPGARLPMYLAMGASGIEFTRFAAWTFLAALIWTPLLVLFAAFAGDAIVHLMQSLVGAGSASLLLAIAAAYILVRIIVLLSTDLGRYRLLSKLARIWRWEFWPSWIFYLPLLPWIAWLSVRYRGFTTITAANPGIPHGGFVGESKLDILNALHSPHVIPTERLDGTDPSTIMLRRGWEFPIILKPDAGQRGRGVSLARDRQQAQAYLRNAPRQIIVQPYHPGPFEAGIFYYRIPGATRGQILSITDKHFSQICGDGRSTLAELIWRHPRYRMQATIFLSRHAADAHRILHTGERFSLGMVGNHCQGTLFCDGSHLLTPELEAKIDQIAQTFDGFFFGRFDVRYSDPERFKLGGDLAILELNGVTSESTNLYDPSWSLLRAYRQLFKQWSILFQIGAANRARGEKVSSLRQLFRDTLDFYCIRERAA